VLARVEGELARWPRRAIALAVGAGVAAITAVALVVWASGGERRVVGAIEAAPVVDAEVVEPAPPPTPVETELAVSRPPPIAVSAGDEIAVELAQARVVIAGPASVRLEANGLIVSEGRVVVAGAAHVKTPRCDARINGSAEIAVGDAAVEIRVRRGSADVSPGCHVSYVALPGPPAAPESRAYPPEPAPDAGPEVPAPPSVLRRQVDAFRRARALVGVDDAAALRALDELIAAWPDSPLRPEIEAARAAAGGAL
jgi:hypothetical protein